MGTQRSVSANICLECLKSSAIFGFNCSESKIFLRRNITLDFRNKKTFWFLLFSKGQICRLSAK